MSFEAKNAQIISEINAINGLRRGRIIGRSDAGTTFTAVGSLNSQTLGRELFIGLKEYRKSHPDVRAPFDFALLRRVAQAYPHLEPELPRVYGLLNNKDNKPLGIIMEDFSEGGRREVFDMAGGLDWKLPEELRALIGDRAVDDYELAKVCFLVDVNGKWVRRWGDFNSILSGLTVSQRGHDFHMKIYWMIFPNIQ